MPLASIPSPGGSTIEVLGLTLRAYGLMIALGVVAAVWLTSKRWQDAGRDPAQISSLAMWSVPAGVVGARIYHVASDYQLFRGDWGRAFEIWTGGLSIWGGVVGGVLGAWAWCRRHDVALPVVLDALAPALPLAQAVGRWGNWWNQELYGKPTDLPWGLEIDPGRRVDGYEDHATFHPMFLYEMLWNLALVGVLLWAERRYRLGRGRLFALYVCGYSLGRLWIEAMRIDEANHVLGVRLNVWTSLLVFAGGALYLWLTRLEPAEEVAVGDGGTPPRTTPSDPSGDDDEPASDPGGDEELHALPAPPIDPSGDDEPASDLGGDEELHALAATPIDPSGDEGVDGGGR